MRRVMEWRFRGKDFSHSHLLRHISELLRSGLAMSDTSLVPQEEMAVAGILSSE